MDQIKTLAKVEIGVSIWNALSGSQNPIKWIEQQKREIERFRRRFELFFYDGWMDGSIERAIESREMSVT